MPYVEKVTEKILVCETVVWPLTLKKPGPGDRGMVTARPVKNLNAGVRRPSKLALIDGQRTPMLELVPSGTPQIRWCGPEGSEFRVFFLTSMSDKCRRQEKKINSPPSVLRHRICGDPEGNNLPVSVVYQAGEVLMDNRHRRSGF